MIQYQNQYFKEEEVFFLTTNTSLQITSTTKSYYRKLTIRYGNDMATMKKEKEILHGERLDDSTKSKFEYWY